jgi:hypothetical protein
MQLPASLVEDESGELFDPVAANGLHFEVDVHRQDSGNFATDRPQTGTQLTAGFTARRPEGCQNQPSLLRQGPLQLGAGNVPQLSLSMTMAIPWPPPTHMVSRP